MRTAIAVVVTTTASLLLAVGESKLIWGYWLQRPSIVSSIDGVDDVLGVSALPLGPASRAPSDHGSIRRARESCAPPSSNECLEGRLLLALDGRTTHIPDVGHDLLREAWSKEQGESPLPAPKDQGHHYSGLPVSGLGIHFRRGGDEYLALAYRTSEIADDRYVYSEALYHLAEGSLIAVRRERFFYEIAGFEAIDWRVLWLLNFLCLFALVTLGAFVRKQTAKLPGSFPLG